MINSSGHDYPPCLVLLLDLSFSSSLLSTKLADIPQKLKYETIIAPLFEYCFGTSCEDLVWENLKDQESAIYEDFNEENLLTIDWIRDETFIHNQIFNLPFEKLDILAKRFGLWKNRSFILQSSQHYYKNYNLMLQINVIDESFATDREILLTLLRENGESFEHYYFDDLRNDFEIVKTAVQQEGIMIMFASDEMKNNKEIVRMAIERSANAFEYISSELRNDKEIVEMAVKECDYVFEFASTELRNDKEFVLFLLESNPSVYGYATDEIILDIDVMTKAISKDISNITTNIAKLIRNDRDKLLIVAKFNGERAMWCASNELRNDYEFAIQCIQQNPLALKYASYELKNDKQLAIQAIHASIKSFELISNELQKDRDILNIMETKDGYADAIVEVTDDEEFAAFILKNSSFAFEHISDRLINDKEFISKSIVKRGYYNLPESLIYNDREVLLESIRFHPTNFTKVPMELKQDREFILQLVQTWELSLQFIPLEYFNDEEIILKASKICNYSNGKRNVYETLSERLKNDRQFILQLAEGDLRVFFSKFPRKLKCDREIVLRAMKNKSNFEKELLSEINNKILIIDRVLAIKMVKVDGMFLSALSYNYRNDREIVSFAVKQNKKALKFASEEVRNDPTILELLE